MGKKKATKNGGVALIPRHAIPPAREYPDLYAAVWAQAAKLRPGEKGLSVTLRDFSASANSLRCALRRAKMKNRVPQDIRVRGGADVAILYREPA